MHVSHQTQQYASMQRTVPASAAHGYWYGARGYRARRNELCGRVRLRAHALDGMPCSIVPCRARLAPNGAPWRCASVARCLLVLWLCMHELRSRCAPNCSGGCAGYSTRSSATAVSLRWTPSSRRCSTSCCPFMPRFTDLKLEAMACAWPVIRPSTWRGSTASPGLRPAETAAPNRPPFAAWTGAGRRHRNGWLCPLTWRPWRWCRRARDDFAGRVRYTARHASPQHPSSGWLRWNGRGH